MQPSVGSIVPVEVEVELVVSDEVLLGTHEDSAYLDGYGPVPATCRASI